MGGSAERFGERLRSAAADWRGLLVAAGLAGEDWPAVLRAAGHPAP